MKDTIDDLKRHWKLIGVVTILVLSYFALTGPKQSVLPGFEGLDSGIEGVTLRGDFYELGDPLPDAWNYDYEWGDTSPRSTILRGRGGIVSDWGGVRVEVGRPQPYRDPFSVPIEVDYWVKDGDNYRHVKGQVQIYEIPVTFSVRREGGIAQYVFEGEKFWFSLVSVAWDKAVQEQSPYSGKTGYGTAWEAPLAAVITSYKVQDKGNHYHLEPSEVGRELVLYDSCEQLGLISDLGYDSDLNGSLAGDVSPDSRLSRVAFMAVTMTDFGFTYMVTSSNAPVSDYKLKVYTIRVGKYTYTNPDDTPWADRPPETTWWEDFQDWLNSALSNPMFILVVIGAVLLFLLSSGILTQAIIQVIAILRALRGKKNGR